MTKQWHNKALQSLRDSLNPVPQELNELDWKSALSDKSEKLARHISAFANTNGGGILAFGVANDASFVDLSQTEIEEIVKTLGNIAKNNLSHAIVLDHAVLESRIISDTIEKGLLKPFDNENISKKFTAYIPFYG